MPGSAIIHAACFAAGAVIGGGVVTAVSSSKKRQIPQASVPTVDSKRAGVLFPPVVEVGANGDARITNAAAALASPVLKYGNPGMYYV